MMKKLVLITLCAQSIFAMQPQGEFKKGKFIPNQVHWSKITPAMEQKMNEQELKKVVIAQAQLARNSNVDEKKNEDDVLPINKKGSS